VLVFLSWATVLLYLLVGPAYRLTLMGAFTSPLAFLLQGIAQGVVGDPGPVRAGAANPWTELHGALSVVAYGAFALAAVAATMYLVQQHQLKTRNLATFFFDLPPIRDLGLANHRLMTAGLALLTLGLGAGFFAGQLPGALKLGAALAVWAIYAGILAGRRFFHLGSGRVALCSVAAFTLSLVALCGITLLSRTQPPG
jgi:HemX protein